MAIALIIIGFLCVLPIACLIGAVKGTIDGCKMVAEQRREQVRDRAIAAGEITPVLELPPDIRDVLESLEQSAETLRRKKTLYEQQSAATMDLWEKVKSQEKADKAGEQIARKMVKINSLKDKYGVLL